MARAEGAPETALRNPVASVAAPVLPRAVLGLPILGAVLVPDGSVFTFARLLLLRQGPRGLPLSLRFWSPLGVLLPVMVLRHPDPLLRFLARWPGLQRLPLRPAFLRTLTFLLPPGGPRFPAFGPGGLLGLPVRPGFLSALPLVLIPPGPRFPPFGPGFLFLVGAL